MRETRATAGNEGASARSQQETSEFEWLDREIEKLRADIRWQIGHIHDVQGKGYSPHLQVLVLRLLCRTLGEERRYRKMLVDLAAARDCPSHARIGKASKST